MKRVKRFFATALAVAMVASVSVPVCAAELPVDEEQVVAVSENSEQGSEDGVMPMMESYRYSVGPNWTRIAYNPNGINGDLYIDIENFNGVLHQVNIIMSDSAGRVVWTEDNCTQTSGTRRFECGANVCSVSIQIKPRWAFVEDHKKR